MKSKVIFIGVITITLLASIATYVYIQNPFYDRSNYTFPSFEINGKSIESFGYILQYDEYDTKQGAIENLASSKYDLLVIDAFYSEDHWTHDDIEAIKSSDQEKIVLSYMSIGEAETYRPYWQETWDNNHDGIPDIGSPEWLDIENPEWEGNFKVKYWMADWQQIIFGTNISYLDTIIGQGFSGTYLDIVDAFEFYEEMGDELAADKMVEFISNISIYAKSIDPNFLIVPQNGESLAEIPGYLEVIDGIGREDIFFNGNSKNSDEEIDFVTNHLTQFLQDDKFVLEIEYCQIQRFIDSTYAFALDSGYICYIGPRDLDILQENEGYEPN